MKLAWITDPHLEFLKKQQTDDFLVQVKSTKADFFLISGDISVAKKLDQTLSLIEQHISPLFFVLGNHDFYGGNIADIREIASQHDGYLPEAGIITLTKNTCLIGHDGWADGRLGDYWNSPVMLADYKNITNFMGLDKGARFRELNRLGDEATDFISEHLTKALRKFDHVVLVTHVPPFRDACWHQGEISDENYTPHFACKAMGDKLLKIMGNMSDHHLTVLCGHTHSSGIFKPLKNITVFTGSADYGNPTIQKILDIDKIA